MSKTKQFGFILGLIILALASRILNAYVPFLGNFAPVTAIALFGAVCFEKRWMSLLLPISLMFASDIIIAQINGLSVIHHYSAYVYGSFILVNLIGLVGKKNIGTAKILGLSLVSSVVFFLVSNFGVWADVQSGYARSFQGLIDCYIMGLPFFQWTVLGDLLFTSVLFGAYNVFTRSLMQADKQ